MRDKYYGRFVLQLSPIADISSDDALCQFDLPSFAISRAGGLSHIFVNQPIKIPSYLAAENMNNILAGSRSLLLLLAAPYERLATKG